ncbi:MAG TPA: dolichol kinase, partial [Chromatiaceae bacterium]|nr:dolichol kinase [Chromatiaceae bacterium]
MNEIFYSIILFIWVVFVVNVVAKKGYIYLRERRSEAAGVYFARKIIHFLAGGLVAILVPFLYRSPLLPLILAIVLTIIVYVPHRTGNLMYWFQDPSNIAEVYFTIMWGIIITIGWLIDVWVGVVPILFMAWGDGITGIIRNFRYSKRTKAWEGNIGMFLLCAPIGYIFFGLIGLLAALASSI